MITYIIICYKHNNTAVNIEIRHATATEVLDIANILKQNARYASVVVIDSSTDRIIEIIE